jgi:CheY-like chemotaxis protein/two-component sensor histidine kinase
VFAGYEAGAVDFLFKPIDPHILKSKADVFFDLHRSKVALAHDLRMHEMFVGVLGHDLRNPLSSIVTGARFLERKTADETTLRTLRRVLSSASRMNDMIEQLLDLTRARLAGGMGFVRERRVVDVAELVTRAVDELRVAAPSRQLAIAAGTDCRTTGDATRLLQVFSNLVSNALHHGTKEAPVAVSVESAADEIVVTVRNEGVIAPELLPLVFDPFRGARRTSTSQGLGLGLFISRQIVDAHGGTIAVESTPAQGTAFTVRLPRCQAKVADGESASKRVLVIDDDEDVREALGHVLSEAGYEAEIASNGREALDRLAERSSRPDVVILDLVMPELDGARLYQVMRSNPSLAGIPVIVSTSSPARAPEGTVVVPKPVKVDRLLDVLSELCREAG